MHRLQLFYNYQCSKLTLTEKCLHLKKNKNIVSGEQKLPIEHR